MIVQRISRHSQRAAPFDSSNPVMHSRPVTDHHTIKSPLFAQDIDKIFSVFCQIGALYLVIGSHDRPRLCLFDNLFKSGQINLTHGALRYLAIAGSSSCLLIVRHIMLKGCADSFCL